MIMQVLAIKDTAMDTYGQPLFVHTIAQGIRIFGDAINNKENPMSKHPEDYNLYHLGEYNDGTGTFIQRDDPDTNGPKQLVLGKQMFNQE